METQSNVAQAIQRKLKGEGSEWAGVQFAAKADLVQIEDERDLQGIPAGPIWILNAKTRKRRKFVFVFEVETCLLYMCPSPIPEYIPVPVGTEVKTGQKEGIVTMMNGEKAIWWK